ncbi:hypothetical protein ACJX0J_035128, partial [Zea mays]
MPARLPLNASLHIIESLLGWSRGGAQATSRMGPFHTSSIQNFVPKALIYEHHISHIHLPKITIMSSKICFNNNIFKFNNNIFKFNNNYCRDIWVQGNHFHLALDQVKLENLIFIFILLIQTLLCLKIVLIESIYALLLKGVVRDIEDLYAVMVCFFAVVGAGNINR